MPKAGIRVADIPTPTPSEGEPRTAPPLTSFAALGTSEIVGRAIGFLATIILARRLGVEAFGYIGFATALLAYYGIALTAGFGDIGAREIARHPEIHRRITADVTLTRVLLAIGALILNTAIAFLFVPVVLQKLVLLFAGLTLITLALDPTWAYRGLGRNRTAAIAFLLSQLIYLTGVVKMVHGRAETSTVPLIQFVADLAAATLLLSLLFRRSIPLPSLTRGWAMFRQAGSITIARIIRTSIVTFDVLLLAILAGSRDVGLYTAAYRVCMLATMIAVATHVAYLPSVTHAADNGRDRLSLVLSRSISLTSAVILPIVLGGMVLAGPLLVLLFGGEYRPAAAALQILLASIGILALHGTTHTVFVALHETRREMMIFGAGAALNIILNLLLIPPFALTGAAFATLAAETLILALCALSLDKWGVRPNVSHILPPLAASGAMALSLFLVMQKLPTWALIPIGGVIYLVIFALTGGLSRTLREAKAE